MRREPDLSRSCATSGDAPGPPFGDFSLTPTVAAEKAGRSSGRLMTAHLQLFRLSRAERQLLASLRHRRIDTDRALVPAVSHLRPLSRASRRAAMIERRQQHRSNESRGRSRGRALRVLAPPASAGSRARLLARRGRTQAHIGVTRDEHRAVTATPARGARQCSVEKRRTAICPWCRSDHRACEHNRRFARSEEVKEDDQTEAQKPHAN
jgi:hypothetical protein